MHFIMCKDKSFKPWKKDRRIEDNIIKNVRNLFKLTNK